MDQTSPPARPKFFAGLSRLPQHRTLQIALVSSLLLFLAQPPVNLWPLAWIAPVPWLWLARWTRPLPGRRPYGALWLAGMAYWLAVNYWLCLPHWATSFGWLALCTYHSFLPVMVVGLGRVAARKLKVGVVFAGPVIWIGFDQLRAYLFTGFSMASLSHSQYRQTTLIQAADLCGEFGVTFAIVMFAAVLARMLPTPDDSRRSLAWAPLGLAVVGLLYAYGRNAESLERAPQSQLKIALIQGSIDSELKYDPGAPPIVFQHYLDQSRQALAADPGVQLIVWPETMFPYPRILVDDNPAIPPEFEATKEDIAERAAIHESYLVGLVRQLDRPAILGIGTTHFTAEGIKGYNSALYLDRTGKPLDRYDKQHLVIFGEYVPLAKAIPFLYKLTPLTGGTEEGAEAKAFAFPPARSGAATATEPAQPSVRLSPSVCYETAMARVIRRQFNELRARDETPDVLVNVTNDGWFWGSSELDLHLACGVFRAVETRRPLVVAANTGFSAHIDERGAILAQGPRRDAGYINAAVTLPARTISPYMAYGDWLAWLCLAATCVFAVVGWRTRS